jgi:hypothetical protein
VTNVKYEVGEKEKHLFTIDHNPVTHRIKIEQDSKIVVNKLNLTPNAQKCEFDIDGSEAHYVEITIGPFTPIELKVDGERAHTLL